MLSRARGLSLVWVGIAAACGSSDGEPGSSTEATSVAECKQQYSPDAGYGWQHDLVHPTSPPDGGVDGADGGIAMSDEYWLDQAVTECAAAGYASSVCDKSQVMTHDAAICVAKLAGLADGIAPLLAGLYFRADYARIVWSVHNTTSDDGHGTVRGNWMRLDAITGALVAAGEWGAEP